MLGEARSSFYHACAPTATQVADTSIGDLIEAVFRRHRARYGYRRIAEDLSDRGVICALARIRRIMAFARLARHSTKNLHSKNQRRQSKQTFAKSALRKAHARSS